VSTSAAILARGPWEPQQVDVRWHPDTFEPAAGATEAADEALHELRERGSPSHDGLAARLVDFEAGAGGLSLELQPVRWALRLLPEFAAHSMSVLCIVRGADGTWLAGRRAGWVASWAGRWALGAAGSVEIDENPVHTLARELREEWSVQAQRLRVEALVLLPTQIVMLIGQVWLADSAAVTPDHEHDAFAWWPEDVDRWPAEADEQLRRVAALLTQS
jgi:ADP-ribose pyrophosphatase YjhB (NUDIX family)